MFCAPSYLDASNVKRLCGRYPSDPFSTHERKHNYKPHNPQQSKRRLSGQGGVGEGRKKRRDGTGNGT